MDNPSEKPDDEKRDDVLKRMLGTKPKPHKAGEEKAPRPPADGTPEPGNVS